VRLFVGTLSLTRGRPRYQLLSKLARTYMAFLTETRFDSFWGLSISLSFDQAFEVVQVFVDPT
jgi:hypothetical protein